MKRPLQPFECSELLGKINAAKHRLTTGLVVLTAMSTLGIMSGQTPANQPATADVLRTIDNLIEQNHKLEIQNRELMEQINALRQKLAPSETPSVATVPQNPVEPLRQTPADTAPPAQDLAESQNAPKTWGTYTPNRGFKLANTRFGDLNLSIYTYGRYLNQRNLEPTYTDAFGHVKTIQQRQDFQLNKMQIKFLGWVMSPKFTYFLYVWTSNASQGLGAQVVLAGNLTYAFSKYVALGVGITGLPGTRSIEGNFPFWLSVDSRLIADEFFRPSYTSGIWARGNFAKRLSYQAMIGNNLSTLGVSAAQLDNHFNTFASALVWNPVGDDFGIGFGDFENHRKLSMRLAGHFTRSDEDKQSQPNTDAIENTQIRLSDGTVIFTPNLFGSGISINNVTYKMTNVDSGVKYRGLSLDGTWYWRWLGNFRGSNTNNLKGLFDQGLELQASAMVVPKTFQVYAGYSKIYGQYGQPWNFRSGLNFFPWKNKVVRWSNEMLYLHDSPVGYTAVPFAVGGKGFVFHSDLELAF